MIRFVKIRAEDHVLLADDPDTGGADGFAWYDTTQDRFLEIADNQVWANWDEFERDWKEERYLDEEREHSRSLDRFKRLFRKD